MYRPVISFHWNPHIVLCVAVYCVISPLSYVRVLSFLYLIHFCIPELITLSSPDKTVEWSEGKTRMLSLSHFDYVSSVCRVTKSGNLSWWQWSALSGTLCPALVHCRFVIATDSLRNLRLSDKCGWAIGISLCDVCWVRYCENERTAATTKPSVDRKGTWLKPAFFNLDVTVDGGRQSKNVETSFSFCRASGFHFGARNIV